MSRPSFTCLAARQFPQFSQETNHPESDAFENIAAGKLLRNAMLLVEVHHIICLTSFVKLPQITRTTLYALIQSDSLILYITHRLLVTSSSSVVSTASTASSSSFTSWQDLTGTTPSVFDFHDRMLGCTASLALKRSDILYMLYIYIIIYIHTCRERERDMYCIYIYVFYI